MKTLISRPDATATPYTTTYEYNAVGLLWKVHDPFGGETEYTYDELGRLKNRELPNGVYTTWTFDDRDRLTELVHRESIGGDVISSFTYEHPVNAVGEPHRITREDGSYIDLVYDDALRLESETYYDSDANNNDLLRKIEYTYDAQGNRTSRTVDGAGEEYEIDPDSGYMLTATGGADGIVGTGDDAVYGYDASGGGRVVSIDRGSDDWTLSYNSAGQVIGVTRAGDTALSYEYDGLGRRTGATAGAQTYDYLIAPAAQRLGLDMEVQHLATSAGADRRVDLRRGESDYAFRGRARQRDDLVLSGRRDRQHSPPCSTPPEP